MGGMRPPPLVLVDVVFDPTVFDGRPSRCQKQLVPPSKGVDDRKGMLQPLQVEGIIRREPPPDLLVRDALNAADGPPIDPILPQEIGNVAINGHGVWSLDAAVLAHVDKLEGGRSRPRELIEAVRAAHTERIPLAGESCNTTII